MHFESHFDENAIFQTMEMGITYTPRLTFTRGFCSGLEMHSAYWLDNIVTELFAANPIEHMSFIDKRPAYSGLYPDNEANGGCYVWVLDRRDSQAAIHYGPHEDPQRRLNATIIDAMKRRFPRNVHDSHNYLTFPTEDAANDALAVTLVDIGRAKVGLPPLRYQISHNAKGPASQ